MFAPVKFELNDSRAKRLITFGVFILVAVTPFQTDTPTVVYFILLAFSLFIYRALAPFERFNGFMWNVDKDRFCLFQKGRAFEADLPTQIINLRYVVFIKVKPTERALPVWISVWYDQLPEREWRRLSVISQYAPIRAKH